MTELVFLSASVPLTKTFTRLADGSITKSSYPHVYEVTSYSAPVNTLTDFTAALRQHSARGRCLIKGVPTRALVKESRAGTTDSNAPTDWICLDLDGIPVATVDDFLKAVGLDDVSHVVQFSASHGIDAKGLRAHVFMLLDKPYAAPLLKQWLIALNLGTPLLSNAMTLTKTGNAILWPLDVSACQNDKLLYIAPPNLVGVTDPCGKSRITQVKRKHDRLSITTAITPTAKNRERMLKRIEELRDADGLPKRKVTFRMHGSTEVMNKPDACTITEMKEERGFTYFNLNGGDSWAYYHPEDNPDYIYNFKGEPAYLTKELLPEYWQQLCGSAGKPNSQGISYLAFCDRSTGAYWRGTYDTAADRLDITMAKNETQVRHFCKQYGVPIGDYVPEWDLRFDPHSTVRVDVANKTVNLFELSTYMKTKAKKVTTPPPTIMKVITHALGGDKRIVDHFINWVAYILQKRSRTGTAWVLHGTEGCLAGDTLVNIRRGKRNAGRPITIKQAYEKWTGKRTPRPWRGDHTVFTKSVKDGMTIGYHEVYDIVEAGEKQLYTLTTAAGRVIRTTAEHPFMRPDGATFTKMIDLRPGDAIVAEGEHNAHIANPQGRKQRATVYSIPHHPYAWQHVIAGKNYKRSHKARLVVEAAMNHLEFDVFIDILRNSPETAAALLYLRETEIVHHLDEDPSNDALSNLEVIDKANHDAHHAKSVGLGTITTVLDRVVSVVEGTIEMTYDITMKAPYQNYVANGLVVHNTGKGVLMNKILRPLFGQAQTTMRRMEEFNEPYNPFMKQCFIVFVDEMQASALVNSGGVMAKMRNFITEPTIQIREMRMNAYEVDNYTNWIFASNKPDPVAIPKDDRRHNVAKFQPTKYVTTPQELEVTIPGELQAFHDYLLYLAVDEQAAHTVLQTADRDVMISISEASIDTVANACLDGNFGFFMDQLPSSDAYKSNALQVGKVEDYKRTLSDLLARTDRNTGVCNVSRDELLTMFDFTIGIKPDTRTPNKFTSLLKHHRIHTTKVWMSGRTVNGLRIMWRDLDQWQEYGDILNPPQAAKPAAKKVMGVK